MAESRKQPLLNLSTLVEREAVSIDGTLYELRNADEFSILDQVQVSKKGERIRALFADDAEPRDEDIATLEAQADWLCRKVLIAPDEIHVRLTTNHRLAVMQAFSDLQRMSMALPAGGEPVAPTTIQPPTGESSSPV